MLGTVRTLAAPDGTSRALTTMEGLQLLPTDERSRANARLGWRGAPHTGHGTTRSRAQGAASCRKRSRRAAVRSLRRWLRCATLAARAARRSFSALQKLPGTSI
jgi:hypothetical protein